MPTAAIELPDTAVRGDDSRFNPTMKQTEAIRYERIDTSLTFTSDVDRGS